MQRLTAPSSIRSLARASSLPPSQTRTLYKQLRNRQKRQPPGTPLRQTFPLFEIPEVLLDLDAENSPYVRKYDEHEEQAQIAQWSKTPKLDSLLDQFQQFSEDLVDPDKLIQETASRIHPWRVLDKDLYSAALLGTAPTKLLHGERDDNAAVIDRLLYQNGIPSRIYHDKASTVHYMLHRQRLFEQNDDIDNGIVRMTIRDCKSVTELRRLISQLSQTTKGCHALARSHEQLYLTFAHFLRDISADNVGRILVTLNNLYSNFRAKEVQLPLFLCELGLGAASIMGQLPAVQNYLRSGIESGYFKLGDFASRVISQAMAAILHNLRTLRSATAPADSVPPYTGTQTEMLTLLTGRTLYSNETVPSFRDAIHSVDFSSPAYTSYLTLLGEVGAIRTLWHEWHRISDGKTPELDQMQQERTDALVGAVLRHAATVKDSRTGSQAMRPIVTGYMAEDIQLDLEQMLLRDRENADGGRGSGTLLTLQQPASQVIPALPLYGRGAGIFREQVIRAFEQPQANMALQAVTELCVSPFVSHWMEAGPGLETLPAPTLAFEAIDDIDV